MKRTSRTAVTGSRARHPSLIETHMRITSILSTVALLASFVPLPAAAQQLPHREHEEGLPPPPETLSPRTRSVGRSVERLREQIHETNRWMTVHGSPEGLHGVGTELAHASEHLQELIRRLDGAYADRDLSADPERRRAGCRSAPWWCKGPRAHGRRG